MARQKEREQLESIYRAVEEHPGVRPGFIARVLKLHRSDVTRTLPALEEHGLLLSEDEKGRLWPFRREG